MREFRHKLTGEIKSQSEWRLENNNISLPLVWNQTVLDTLNIEIVLETPKPNVGPYQIAIRSGAVKDSLGNWVQAWTIQDMFSDYIDSQGILHTKAEQEQEYQKRLDEETAELIRTHRNNLIAETDWTALSDVTMSAEMAAYRQALRDITSQENFPYNIIWPEKP